MAPIRRLTPLTHSCHCNLANLASLRERDLNDFKALTVACDVLRSKGMEIHARRVELTAKYLERASHFFALAAKEVRDSNSQWGCPSIAHAMASALDAQRAAGGALDHIDPATITKEI